MPGRKPARNTPGTERFRDERRPSGGARMHGRLWHDHEQPKAFEPEAFAGGDAVPEVESSGQRVGMGKHRADKSALPGGTRRKRMTPPGKGPKRKKSPG